jgi:CheY-like chemotaxis protein
LNGFEVLAVIKTDPELSLVPVVVLTNSTTSLHIFQVDELHANCCIVKPIDLEHFFELIQVTIRYWLCFVTLPLAVAQ